MVKGRSDISEIVSCLCTAVALAGGVVLSHYFLLLSCRRVKLFGSWVERVEAEFERARKYLGFRDTDIFHYMKLGRVQEGPGKLM